MSSKVNIFFYFKIKVIDPIAIRTNDLSDSFKIEFKINQINSLTQITNLAIRFYMTSSLTSGHTESLKSYMSLK